MSASVLAGIDVKTGKWVIGDLINGNRNDRATLSEVLVPGVTYPVEVRLNRPAGVRCVGQGRGQKAEIMAPPAQPWPPCAPPSAGTSTPVSCVLLSG